MNSPCFEKILRFFSVFFSYVRAVLRLLVWTVLFFVAGLQRTLFMRSEIVCVEFKTIPLKCDVEDFDDKMSYIDKMCSENPDLAEISDIDDEDFDDFDNDEGDIE